MSGTKSATTIASRDTGMCTVKAATLPKSSMETSCTSRLLDLPPELRNIIYEYAVIDAQDIEVTLEQQPGLIRTCSEIRSECRQMYYAKNTFTFSPSTRDEEDALRPLEQWLMRIGPENCGSLDSFTVILNSVTGLLINEPNSTTDPWTSVTDQMSAAGCCPYTTLKIKLHQDIFPKDNIFEEGLAALGSRQEVLRVVEQRRKTMQAILSTYILLLNYRQYDKATLEDWEAKEFPTGKIVELVKEAVHTDDATRFWIRGKVTQFREDFPYKEVTEGLASCVEYFNDYYASEDEQEDELEHGDE